MGFRYYACAGRTTTDARTLDSHPAEKRLMATDYDAPRRTEADELAGDSLEELKARRAEGATGEVDVDETDTAESYELPGADLSGEELTVRVVPEQDNEFTCGECFLVHHRSRLAEERDGLQICVDCAG